MAVKEIFVPDIGSDDAVDVIEVLVTAGQTIDAEAALITLESDKASMDVPSPVSGVIKELKVRVGDKVSKGTLIALMEVAGAASSAPEAPKPAEAVKAQAPKAEAPKQPVAAEKPAEPVDLNFGTDVHAGPAVRQYARELGIDLRQLKGTGPKDRIIKVDVVNYVKNRMQGAGSAGGFSLPPIPDVDFSQFGEVDTKALSRIKKLSGANLHRNWISVPHVTQFDEADITEMEAFRQAQKHQAEKQGYKLTPLAFIIKAVVGTLKAFPTFNASLASNGENLILKKYYHIGVAVDTPEGLMVPVVRDADKKSVGDLAKELAEISQRAREKKLTSKDLQGSSFTISSLGGIGGTAFTPIVNVPDVAILGVSKSTFKPVYQEGEFVPRLMLPLSLSYDHRVIDGAEGARFTQHLVELLSDIRRIIL